MAAHVRRAENFGVRRWLQLGAASAGVSAALFGLSALGPVVGVALADESGSSSSDGSAASDTSTSSSSSADADAQSKGASPAAPSPTTTSSQSSPSPSASTSSSSTASKTDADDKATVTAQTNTGSLKSSVTGSDDPAPAEPTSASSSSPSSDSVKTAAVVKAPAAASVAAPAASETVAAQADPSPSPSSSPSSSSPSPSPSVAAADPVIPWALQVTAPADARKQVIADQLTAWTNSSMGWIDSLPVPAALKWNLEGALWTVRRGFLNLAPTVAPITVTGLSDALVTGHVDAVDPEGDAIVYRLVKGPASGSLQLNADGTFTYTPGTGFEGVDSFVVMAQDVGLHVNLVDLFRGQGTAAGALVNEGAIKFAFNYTTGADYWSTDARNALQSAANSVASYFLVTSPVVIDYDVTGENDPATSLLAAAGSDLVTNTAGFWQTVVQNKLLSGVDSNGAAADGEIDWNWGRSWALGDTVGSDSFDFMSTAMHELLHSFGFLSYVAQPGSNTNTAWPLFASFITAADGTRAIGADYAWNSALDPNLTGANGGLYFGGANAVAAYGGQLVPLYTPNPWESGSSMSHLDDTTFTGSNQQLMNAKTDTGLGVRVLSPIELGLLEDIGYTVVVPQAPTAALAMIGFVFIRRARKK
ncbi:MAG: hypothetical protein QOE74_818 [Mycobacterium sp.]|nr:hypothetical protein [Mycobacterium sp.]